MWLLIGIQVFVIILFLILGWAIRSKQMYGLISGFANRTDEEQKQFIERGYPQKTGSLLMMTAVEMLLLMPLSFTPFLYSIEVQFGFMTIFLLGGFIYLSKYEIPKKQKRSYWVSSILFVVMISFVIVVYSLGYQNNELVLKEETFEVTGLYGDEWKLDDIKQIELLQEMPEVTWKQNGFGTAARAKGYFKVTGYDSSLLFIHKDNPPYLFIKTNNKNLFINSENLEQTLEWYEELSEKVEESQSGE